MRHTAFSFSPILFFALILLSSCAQVVAPSGGKIDNTPPHVTRYKPDSAAVNFKAKHIEIEFDEFVVLKDQTSQILISPLMDKQPDVHVDNKSIIIDLKAPLKDSTTYTISFGNAIQDNHEGKSIANFRYVFSTGTYVDSLALSGNVINALTRQPEKSMLVMLYAALSDSTPFLQTPAYFARTDASGNYRIENVKPGTYKVFALLDANANYKFNSSEQLGFIEEPFNFRRNDTINLVVFKQNPEVQRIKKAYQDGYRKIKIAFAMPAEDISLEPLNMAILPEQSVIEKTSGGDTLSYWFKIPESDSLILRVRDKRMICDTLRYKLFTRTKLINQNKGKKPFLVLTTNLRPDKLFDLDSPILFEFASPVTDLVTAADKIQLREDTLKKNIFERGKLFWKDKQRSLRFRVWSDSLHPLKESHKYHLLVLPGAFTDIQGFTNDTVKIDFRTQESRYYGTLKMHLHVSPGTYLLQLLDEGGNIVRSVSLKQGEDLDFNYLPPAKYQVRLIYDSNGNGRWDTGNYLKHLQPERVVYDSQIIVIRSNWKQTGT
jgi:uncharacterized protein (DUF2141 family)